MKKCPNCQKTYEDNLKYCQSDGTPLVVVAEEQPSDDPFKTMVASDLKLPSEEPVVEKTSPADSVAPESSAGSGDLSDVLEIPEKADSIDLMKTMVATGADTSDSVKIPDLAVPEPEPEPEAEPEPEPIPEMQEASAEEPSAEIDTTSEDFEIESEAATVISPEIPKFSEPEIEPPVLDIPDKGSGLFGEKPAPNPDVKSKGSVPIPSPFDKSMPPGFAAPESSPFEEAPDAESKDSASPPPASPFTEKSADTPGKEGFDIASPPAQVPAAVDDPGPFGSNSILNTGESPPEGPEGENKTLAIVSLVSGIAGVLCCAAGILFGPVALITGYMAKGKISEDPSVYGGMTFAKIGMILGIVGVLLSIIVIGLNIFSVLGSL